MKFWGNAMQNIRCLYSLFWGMQNDTGTWGNGFTVLPCNVKYSPAIPLLGIYLSELKPLLV